ncbi:MAG TPA: alkyl hydroperoxide reductase [Planctomycetaceae bacterium]|nr:alkyl hydroperoxide reductase [Planctomycetaceae bacterium]
MITDLKAYFRRAGFIAALSAGLAYNAPVSFAQEGAAEAPATDSAEGDTEEKAEEDPLAVPADGTTEELLEFIQGAMRVPPPAGMNRTEFAGKVFPAMIEAAEVILDREDASDSHAQAIQWKLRALTFLGRYKPDTAGQAEKFIEELINDDRKEIAVIGASQKLMLNLSSLRSADAEEAGQAADDAIKLIENYGLSTDTFTAASQVGSYLGRTKHTDVAVGLCNKLADLAEKSDNEDLVASAGRMRGTARRLGLMGSEMEVFGTTADGKEFAMSDYKGKVVLVDFWASWCGPCIGEIPNMKRNLEAYGDKGFEIVGINMDSTEDRFLKCIEERSIGWTNIVSWEEGKNGWQAPMATHYGISGIPTAILVDQTGNVVSLNARGGELDKKLEELLGPPPKKAEAEEQKIVDEEDDSEEDDTDGDSDK